MQIDSQLADAAVVEELGRRLRRLRLDRNLTQQDLADEAGVSVATVRNLESGSRTQLVTLIRVLRTLDLLSDLDRLLPARRPSPIELLKLRGRERQRASSPRTARP